MEFEFIEHMRGMDIRMFIVTIYKRQTHFHNDIEILMPLEGSVIIDVSTRRTLVETGDFFIVNRNESHSLGRTEASNILLVLQFSPNFCKDYYPQLLRMRIEKRHIVRKSMPELYGQLKTTFAHMLRAMVEKRDGYQLELMGALNAIVYAMVCRGICEKDITERPIGEEKNRARLTSIVDYIQKNYTHSVSLAELSKAENLDMTYLSHFIKKQLGISFREYVNRLRLEHAVDLITNTHMRMIDVCVECGYSDYRYLNKAILSEFGMSPAQLREKGFLTRPMLFAAPDQKELGEHSYMNLNAVYARVCAQLESMDPPADKPDHSN